MALKEEYNNKGIILIADIDEISANKLKAFVIGKGYQVHITNNGQDVIKYILYQDIYLVFIDVELKDGKGYKLIPHIKELMPELHVVVSSNVNSIEIEEKIRGIGVFYYCLKPYDYKEIDLILKSSEKRAYLALCN